MQLRRVLPPVLFALAILTAAGPWGSGDMTGPVATSWLEKLGLSATVAELVHEIVRKIGHFLAYGSFAWVTMRSIVGANAPTPRHAGLAWALAVLLAVADESIQSFWPGRTGTAKDVALDACGAAVFLAHLLLRARDPSVRNPSVRSQVIFSQVPVPDTQPGTPPDEVS